MILLSSGKIASKGYALGKALLIDRAVLKAETHLIAKEQITAELERFDYAVSQATDQLASLNDPLGLFRAHISLIRDEPFYQGVLQRIREEQQNAQLALENTATALCTVFEEMRDPYFSARGDDIKDVTVRLMRILKGIKSNPFENITSPVIVIAKELSPSELTNMDKNDVLGLATQEGSITSHLSILAEGMGLPALVGVEGLMEKVREGDYLILDACQGKLLNCSDEIADHTIIEDYKATSRLYYQSLKEQKELDLLPATTLDGKAIKLYANAGNLDDIKKAMTYQIEGIGLLRSEALYMEYPTFPTEEEQFLVYKEAALQCRGNLIIRTLDIGGDKTLPYYPLKKEDNPFLGWRGIRICLESEVIFKAQLRAILRAAKYGKIKVMYPMITSLEELLKANHILSACKEELKAEGIPYEEDLKVGIMMETPAAVLCAEELARHVDYFSIGTNDLIQYLLAVDRGNPKVASLFDPFHPAIIRSLKKIIDVAHTHNIDVSICGALAGDERATLLLLGLGLDRFSLSVSEVMSIKRKIRSLSYEKAKECALQALNASTTEDVMRCLNY